MEDKHIIDSEEQLQSIIGEPLDFIKDKVESSLDDSMIEFIRRSPLLFFSTIDEHGQIDSSPKGDAAGFVKTDAAGNVLIPDRPGNKLVFGFRNILSNPNVGLIFVVPNMRETLRIKGRAAITNEPTLLQELSAKGKPALLCTRIEVNECFFHCGKAMIRSKMWQPDTWASHEDSLMVRQFTKILGGDEEFERVIETEIEKNYREELY
jgi:PPOX class probable FMN-dependent enzyme